MCSFWGTRLHPKTRDVWKDCVKTRFWIYFTPVRGLTIDETGTLDGQGSIWWDNQIYTRDSPSTYGIDISASICINIHDLNIQTGDDCVAINGGVYDINITRVFCRPGHGIRTKLLPRHVEILEEINKRFIAMIKSTRHDLESKISDMQILNHNPNKLVVHMTYLCVVSRHTLVDMRNKENMFQLVNKEKNNVTEKDLVVGNSSVSANVKMDSRDEHGFGARRRRYLFI
nr:probable polygalacturonase At3g15720 [Tanacetum cinerariifolium]